MGKLDIVREKAMDTKTKWKERMENFKQKHPRINEGIETVGVACGVVLMWAVPLITAYSMGRSDEKINNSFDEYKYEVNRGMRRIIEGPNDFIDKEGQYHQDIGYDYYAVWSSKEAYLEAEANRVNEKVPRMDL